MSDEPTLILVTKHSDCYFLLSGSLVSSLNDRCNTFESGIPRFGDRCQYKCHCVNKSEQCDVITGNCVTGCDFKWAGPGCQFSKYDMQALVIYI